MIPPYVFRRRQFAAVIKALAEAQFTFKTSISSTTGAIWQQLDQEIHAHIRTAGLYLPRKLRDDGQTYENLSWDLLTPTRYKSGVIVVKNESVAYTTATRDIACYEFSSEHLDKMAIAHPFDAHGLPVLLVGSSGRLYLLLDLCLP
jgi:hypothetical protein